MSIDRYALSDRLTEVCTQNHRQYAKIIFDDLGHPKPNKMTEQQLDKLLIWAVAEEFGRSVEADMSLVAFGLLAGFHYSELSLFDRRAKYLDKSNYLQLHSRKKVDFYKMSEEEKKAAIDSYRKPEHEKIQKVADLLTDYLQTNNITQLMKELNSKDIKVPIPSYQVPYETEETGFIIKVAPGATVILAIIASLLLIVYHRSDLKQPRDYDAKTKAPLSVADTIPTPAPIPQQPLSLFGDELNESIIAEEEIQ